MVYTLASNKDEVKYRASPHVSPRKGPNRFTAYGFWCAGLDTGTFPLIGDDDRVPYQRLLTRTCDGERLYNVRSQGAAYLDEVIEDKGNLIFYVRLLHLTGPIAPTRPVTVVVLILLLSVQCKVLLHYNNVIE